MLGRVNRLKLLRAAGAGARLAVQQGLALRYLGGSRGYQSRPAIKRGRTKARARARWQVGDRVGSSSAKHDGLQETAVLLTTRTKSDGLRLLALPKGTDNADMSTRLTNVVNFRGLKLCMTVRNNLDASYQGNLFFNWAIISPKQQDNEIASISNSEFFRGAGDTRYVDFTPTNITALDAHCSAINTDKYVVHRHMRYRIKPASSTEGQSIYINEWIKVGRQIRYNAVGSGVVLDYPEGRDMWFVYWCALEGEAAGVGISSAIGLDYKFIRYFREPKP